jgi:hypothetical protein
MSEADAAVPAAAILAGWREAEQAATEGPWGTDENHGRGYDDEGWSRCFILGALDSATLPVVAATYFTDIIEPDNAEADAAFIVAARTAMPLLLGAVERALELADEWEDSAAIIDPATPLREAITAALTGKEAGDGMEARP